MGIPARAPSPAPGDATSGNLVERSKKQRQRNRAWLMSQEADLRPKDDRTREGRSIETRDRVPSMMPSAWLQTRQGWGKSFFTCHVHEARCECSCLSCGVVLCTDMKDVHRRRRTYVCNGQSVYESRDGDDCHSSVNLPSACSFLTSS
jgi:hypothetical protein